MTGPLGGGFWGRRGQVLYQTLSYTPRGLPSTDPCRLATVRGYSSHLQRPLSFTALARNRHTKRTLDTSVVARPSNESSFRWHVSTPSSATQCLADCAHSHPVSLSFALYSFYSKRIVPNEMAKARKKTQMSNVLLANLDIPRRGTAR